MILEKHNFEKILESLNNNSSFTDNYLTISKSNSVSFKDHLYDYVIDYFKTNNLEHTLSWGLYSIDSWNISNRYHVFPNIDQHKTEIGDYEIYKKITNNNVKFINDLILELHKYLSTCILKLDFINEKIEFYKNEYQLEMILVLFKTRLDIIKTVKDKFENNTFTCKDFDSLNVLEFDLCKEVLSENIKTLLSFK